MSWTIDVVHFFIAYVEGWWFFSLYYIIIKSIWNYAYYIASSSPFIALLISPNFSLIWFIYFIPTVHKNFIRGKILWNAQIDQWKKKKFNFFFIFLIFIAWKQIIMHMLPSFCTQHFFSYACNLQLPPPLDLNLPMLRPPPPKTPETGCCSSVWAVLEPLPVPEDFSAVEWTTSFPSCSSAVPVEIPWGPLWCWICSVVLVVPEPALVVPREAWWEISSPLWCFQRADSPSKQQITYNLFIACSSVFRELERGWFRALEGSDSVFSIDLCAWCSPMSSSHARLHFFLTSSFHRFFFHESVFFYENEQSHIRTIYYHQLLLKPTF